MWHWELKGKLTHKLRTESVNSYLNSYVRHISNSISYEQIFTVVYYTYNTPNGLRDHWVLGHISSVHETQLRKLWTLARSHWASNIWLKLLLKKKPKCHWDIKALWRIYEDRAYLLLLLTTHHYGNIAFLNGRVSFLFLIICKIRNVLLVTCISWGRLSPLDMLLAVKEVSADSVPELVWLDRCGGMGPSMLSLADIAMDSALACRLLTSCCRISFLSDVFLMGVELLRFFLGDGIFAINHKQIIINIYTYNNFF